MAIDEEDANFSLDMWASTESDDDPITEYALDRATLEARAKEILSAGKYRYLVLYQWDDASEEWANVAEFEG